MHVNLTSVGNPDFRQDPNAPISPPEIVEVSSLQEASAKCLEYIEWHDLGGGNWSGGQVYIGTRLVGQVSYNGKVWDGPCSLYTEPALLFNPRGMDE